MSIPKVMATFRADSGRNQGVSNNADAVKYFLSVVIRALRGARHFALAEQVPGWRCTTSMCI
jgi:hypothetical protein